MAAFPYAARGTHGAIPHGWSIVMPHALIVLDARSGALAAAEKKRFEINVAVLTAHDRILMSFNSTGIARTPLVVIFL